MSAIRTRLRSAAGSQPTFSRQFYCPILHGKKTSWLSSERTNFGRQVSLGRQNNRHIFVVAIDVSVCHNPKFGLVNLNNQPTFGCSDQGLFFILIFFSYSEVGRVLVICFLPVLPPHSTCGSSRVELPISVLFAFSCAPVISCMKFPLFDWIFFFYYYFCPSPLPIYLSSLGKEKTRRRGNERRRPRPTEEGRRPRRMISWRFFGVNGPARQQPAPTPWQRQRAANDVHDQTRSMDRFRCAYRST